MKLDDLYLLKDEEIEVPEEILKLVEERNSAKANKDYAKADEIRGLIEEKGYLIKDSREGTKIEKK